MPNDTPSKWIDERVAVLEGDAGPEELEAAAGELASSDDPQALEALGSLLGRSEFLDQLDPPDSYNKIAHLTGVFASLIERPSPEVARLCLRLVDEPMYLEHDRKSLVLEALAGVVPMSPDTAAAFERANEDGYFGFDALLLARNSSAVALDLYQSMMSDHTVDIESRVELVRKGILPYRNRVTILRTAAALIDSNVEPLIATTAMESIFDYQPEWFLLHGPTPPPWRTAPEEVLRYVLQLASMLIDKQKAPTSLIAAMERTTSTVRALLAARAN
jgi:hypothetical protein